MSPTNRHKYKYFHSTVQRAKYRRQKFHFCRLPFDVRPRNVKLNLSNFSVRDTALLSVHWLNHVALNKGRSFVWLSDSNQMQLEFKTAVLVYHQTAIWLAVNWKIRVRLQRGALRTSWKSFCVLVVTSARGKLTTLGPDERENCGIEISSLHMRVINCLWWSEKFDFEINFKLKRSFLLLTEFPFLRFHFWDFGVPSYLYTPTRVILEVCCQFNVKQTK